MLEMTFSPQKGSLIYPSSLSDSVCGHTLGIGKTAPPPSSSGADSNLKNKTKCQIQNVKMKITSRRSRSQFISGSINKINKKSNHKLHPPSNKAQVTRRSFVSLNTARNVGNLGM